MTLPQPPLRLRLRGRIDDVTERMALRATLTAAHLLGLATGTHLRTLRGHPDPMLDLQARVEEAQLKAQLSIDVAQILAARFSKFLFNDQNGRRRCKLVRRADEGRLQLAGRRYREFREKLQQLRAIDQREKEILVALRDARALNYE